MKSVIGSVQASNVTVKHVHAASDLTLDEQIAQTTGQVRLAKAKLAKMAKEERLRRLTDELEALHDILAAAEAHRLTVDVDSLDEDEDRTTQRANDVPAHEYW